MDAVQLKMNDIKTKFIYFGGPRKLEKCIVNQININEKMIQRSHITRYLETIQSILKPSISKRHLPKLLLNVKHSR